MRIQIFTLPVASVLLGLISTSVFAQGIERDDGTHVWLRELSALNSQSTGAGFESEFAIEAGDADSKASIALTRMLNRDSDGRVIRYQLRAAAPFNSEKSSNVDLGSLSGLTAGTNVAFEASWMHWPPVPDNVWADVEVACIEKLESYIPGFTHPQIAQSGVVVCAKGRMNRPTLEKVVTGLKSFLAGCKKTLASAKTDEAKKSRGYRACETVRSVVDKEPKLADEVDKLLAQNTAAFENAIDATFRRISLITLGAKVNQQKFDYVTEADPTTKLSESKNGWSVSLAYTQVRRNSLWSAGFSHEESYKGGSTTEICIPFGTTGALSCSSAATQAPARKSKELLFGEFRQIVPGMNIAIAPRVEFDLEESDWALKLPIYLVRNKKGAFSAGIGLGWDSETSDVGASVFVGKSFDFFQ